MDFSVPEWARSPRRSRRLFLTLSGPTEKRWCVHEKSCYVVGRSPSCDIAVDNKNASRAHACLCHGEADQLFIMDLGSVHGTFLNGERLEAKQRRPICAGSVIKVADSREFFTLQEAAGNEGSTVANKPVENQSQGVQQEEYDPFGDIGAEESSPDHARLPIPAPPNITTTSGAGNSLPPVPVSTTTGAYSQSRGREVDRGGVRRGSREGESRKYRSERGGGRNREGDKRGDGDRYGGDHTTKERGRRRDSRRERRDGHRRDRSPRSRGREGRRDRRHQERFEEKKRELSRDKIPDPERKKRKTAFSEAAPMDKSADIVKSMMQAPGQLPVPSMGLSIEQKKELLWGKKKVERTDHTSTAVGVNRWDTAQFGSSEEQNKFQRLMGVKGEPRANAAAAPDDGERKVLAGEEQAQVLRSVEEHFVAGLRRADGRTVGLGL